MKEIKTLAPDERRQLCKMLEAMMAPAEEEDKRQARGGSSTTTDASAACLLFRNDLPHDYEIVEMTATLLNRAMTLAEIHGLHGYDAVQLAAACEINVFCAAHGLLPLTLASAYSELKTASTREGLPIDDPNAHP